MQFSTMVGATLAMCTLATFSCGGNVGSAVRPDDLTGRQALGVDVKCTATKDSEPLLVDLPGEMRGELEAQLRQGVAIVSYDCKSLRVMTECKLESGSYRFSGWTMKSSVVQIKDRNELKANLPLSSTKLGGAVESGRSIDLAILNVGSHATTVMDAASDRLTGNCAGATHFVKKAYLGAFAMTTSSSGKVSAAVDLFGKVGVSGQSEQERNASSTDGSLDACKTADPEAPKPPSGCSVPVRAVLVPIAAASAPRAGKPKKGEIEPDRDPCPPGFKLSEGACRTNAATHLCDPDNLAECTAECGKGDLGSCFNLGHLKYVASDLAGAKEAFGKACAGGHVDACGGAARASYPENKDRAQITAALELSKKACLGGSSIGCWDAYVYLHDATTSSLKSMIDYGQALKFALRGCDLGDSDSCLAAGQDLVGPPPGAPFAQDTARGFALWQARCDAGDGSTCHLIAETLFRGLNGVPVDVERAARASRVACDLDVETCNMHIGFLEKANKMAQAFHHARRSCETAKEVEKVKSCKLLSDYYAAGTGTAKDPAAAKAALQRSQEGEEELCRDGNKGWCKKK